MELDSLSAYLPLYLISIIRWDDSIPSARSLYGAKKSRLTLRTIYAALPVNDND